MDAEDLHFSTKLGLSSDGMLASVQLGIRLLGFHLRSMHFELLTLVVLLSEVLLLSPHLFVILFLEFQLVLDVLNIAVNGLERF